MVLSAPGDARFLQSEMGLLILPHTPKVREQIYILEATLVLVTVSVCNHKCEYNNTGPQKML